jgi:hypothetical protein
MLAPTLPDLSQLDREALQVLLLAERQARIAAHQQLLRREIEIEHQKLLLSLLDWLFEKLLGVGFARAILTSFLA